MEVGRLRVHKVLLSIFLSELWGSIKLVAEDLLSSGPLKTQVDVVLNDVVLARWQYRLTKDPLSPSQDSLVVCTLELHCRLN